MNKWTPLKQKFNNFLTDSVRIKQIARTSHTLIRLSKEILFGLKLASRIFWLAAEINSNLVHWEKLQFELINLKK